MAINTIYKLDKIVFALGQELHAVNNEQQQFGIKLLKERSAGEVWPNFVANQEQKPMVNVTTRQLNTLLTNVPIVGTASLANITCYLKKGSATGSVARASLVHEQAVIAESCVYWTSIRLPHNGEGEAQAIIAPVFDGTNDPLVFTGSVALPGSLAASDYFGCGPVSLNGVAIPGVQEITIESGIKLLQLGDASEEFDTFVGVEQGEAVITVKTLEQTNWASLGLRGTALNGTTGLVCYGRKYAAGGSRVANATAEHLKFVALNGKAIPVDTSGQDSSPVSDTLRVEIIDPTSAGAGVTVTVASAIT